MPVESNIGFSESTAIKHEQLRKFMRMHLTKATAIPRSEKQILA